MLTSEIEARQKWCPSTRVEGQNRLNNSLTGGFDNTHEQFHCIASKCMLWREFHFSHMKHGAEKTLATHGYCGLGGKPDLE